MAASKQLQALEYEQIMEVMRQFHEKHPQVKQRADFLGISIAMEAGGLVMKLTVTQPALTGFSKQERLPKDFEAKLGAKKAILKIVVLAAPILTNASPKSNRGRPAPAVNPAQTQSQAPATEA